MEEMIKVLSKDVLENAELLESLKKHVNEVVGIYNGNFNEVAKDIAKLVRKNRKLKLGIIGLAIAGGIGAYVAYQKYQEMQEDIEALRNAKEATEEEW